jgi:hypothetical protein
MGNVYSLLCPGMAPTMFIPGLNRRCPGGGGGKSGAETQRIRPRRAMVYSSPYGSCNNIVVKIIDDEVDSAEDLGEDFVDFRPLTEPQDEEMVRDPRDFFVRSPSGQMSAHSSPPKTPTDGLQRTGSIYAMRDFTEAARQAKEQRQREIERSRENLSVAAGAVTDNNNAGEDSTHLKPTALQKVVRVIKVSMRDDRAWGMLNQYSMLA